MCNAVKPGNWRSSSVEPGSLKAWNESRDRALGAPGWRCGWIFLIAKILRSSSETARLLPEKHASKISDLVRSTRKSRSHWAVSYPLETNWDVSQNGMDLCPYQETWCCSWQREILCVLQPEREENTQQSSGNVGSVQVHKASVSCFPHIVSDGNHLW